MNEPTIPTMAEHMAELERTAIARCVCKKGDNQFPTEREVAAELRLMGMEEVHGTHVEPRLTLGKAQEFLRLQQLPVPPKEKPAKDFG